MVGRSRTQQIREARLELRIKGLPANMLSLIQLVAISKASLFTLINKTVR